MGNKVYCESSNSFESVEDKKGKLFDTYGEAAKKRTKLYKKIFKIRKNKMVRKCCITRRNQNRKEKHLDKIKRIRKRNQPTNNDTNS